MLSQLHSQAPAKLDLCSGDQCPTFCRSRAKKWNTKRALVPSLAQVLGLCARTSKLCPKCSQCYPSLSALRCILSSSSDPSSSSPSTTLPPDSLHAVDFPARMAGFDTVLSPGNHKDVWGHKLLHFQDLSGRCLCWKTCCASEKEASLTSHASVFTSLKTSEGRYDYSWLPGSSIKLDVSPIYF